MRIQRTEAAQLNGVAACGSHCHVLQHFFRLYANAKLREARRHFQLAEIIHHFFNCRFARAFNVSFTDAKHFFRKLRKAFRVLRAAVFCPCPPHDRQARAVCHIEAAAQLMAEFVRAEVH